MTDDRTPQDQALPPPPRGAQVQGPRPLPLHLALQTMIWTTSLAALPPLKNGSLSWRPELAEAGNALQQNLENVNPEDFFAAVEAESRHRLDAFAKGVTAYRTLKRPPRPEDPPVFWQEGTTRILDFASISPDTPDKKPGRGMPVLLIPSLINRAYVLDLTADTSLARYLAGQGFRPFLVDWDTPGDAELEFDLGDYIAGRLERGLDAITQDCGRNVLALGYCMGGNLALALAQRRPDAISALTLLATPWDFHAPDSAPVRILHAIAPQLNQMIDTFGLLPVDVLQAMFASLDPTLSARKFQRFAGMDKRSAKARHFIALEDWLNDGVPLASKVARECLFGWYMENTPMTGDWKIEGRAVVPEEVEMPALSVIPDHDYIVPPESSLPLAERLPRSEVRRLAAGHIGMVVGGSGKTRLFPLLGEWLQTHVS